MEQTRIQEIIQGESHVRFILDLIVLDCENLQEGIVRNIFY